MCPSIEKLRLIRVDDRAREFNGTFALLPWNRALGLADAFPAPGNNRLITVVRGDGAVFQMDKVTLSFAPTPQRAEWKTNGFDPGKWPISHAGRQDFHLGYGHPSANSLANEFRVFDPVSWKQVGTIETSAPFSSAALSSDGTRLYALAPQRHSVLVIDTVSMRQIKTFAVGSMPTLAIACSLSDFARRLRAPQPLGYLVQFHVVYES